MVLYDVKSWIRCVMEEIVRFNSTLVIDDEGAQYIKQGRGWSSPVGLVFWVELGLMFEYVAGFGGPRPEELRLMGIMS